MTQTRAIATPPGESTDREELTTEEEQALQDRRTARTPSLSDLKTKRKREIKRQARRLLNDTDWYIVRNKEQEIRGQSPQGVPAVVTDHRDEVRRLEDDAMDAIDSAGTKDAVRDVSVDWPEPPEPPL